MSPFRKENYWWCIHDPEGTGDCSRRSDNFCLGSYCLYDWDGYDDCKNCTLNKTSYCDNCFLNQENQKEISEINLWCFKCKNLLVITEDPCKECAMNKIDKIPTKFISNKEG